MFQLKTATESQKATLIEICSKHGINIDGWCEREGRTLDTLTGNEAGRMLLALKTKYGDD